LKKENIKNFWRESRVLINRILKFIIEAEEPVSSYRIAKKLGENAQTVDYNIKKLLKHDTILPVKKRNKSKATYYVPNQLFTQMDTLLEILEPVIYESVLTAPDLNEKDAKFNFKLLMEYVINDIDFNNGKRENDFPKGNRKKS